MSEQHRPLVLEIRIGKRDFPVDFTELWEELDRRMFLFSALDKVRIGYVTTRNAFGTLTLLEFAVYYAKALVHDAKVKGMKKHVGDIVDKMLEIITDNPADDQSVFGRFCTLMNKVQDEFGDGSLKFKNSSMRDECFFAWKKAR